MRESAKCPISASDLPPTPSSLWPRPQEVMQVSSARCFCHLHLPTEKLRHRVGGGKVGFESKPTCFQSLPSYAPFPVPSKPSLSGCSQKYLGRLSSFHKHLLRAYCVPGAGLHTGIPAGNRLHQDSHLIRNLSSLRVELGDGRYHIFY